MMASTIQHRQIVHKNNYPILKILLNRFTSKDRLPLPSYLTSFEFEHDVI